MNINKRDIRTVSTNYGGTYGDCLEKPWAVNHFYKQNPLQNNLRLNILNNLCKASTLAITKADPKKKLSKIDTLADSGTCAVEAIPFISSVAGTIIRTFPVCTFCIDIAVVAIVTTFVNV